MNANHIIKQLQDRKHVVVIKTPAGLSVPKEIVKESWQLHITNSPENYFADMRTRYNGRATYEEAYLFDTFDNAAQAVKEIGAYYEQPQVKVEKDEKLDLNKPIYLTVHIHYTTSNKIAA